MLEPKGPDEVSEVGNDCAVGAVLEPDVPVSDAEVSDGDEAGDADVEDARLLLLV